MLFEMLQVYKVFSYSINLIVHKVFITNVIILCQFPSLNKRLVIVILEGAIKTIFPDQDFTSVFLKLHSRSSRYSHQYEQWWSSFAGSHLGLKLIFLNFQDP